MSNIFFARQQSGKRHIIQVIIVFAASAVSGGRHAIQIGWQERRRPDIRAARG